MLRLNVAQYPTEAVSADGNRAQNDAFPLRSPSDSDNRRPRPPPALMAQSSRMPPPASNSGADQLSSSLIPSVPLKITATWISQNTVKVMAVPPGTPAHPGQAA